MDEESGIEGGNQMHSHTTGNCTLRIKHIPSHSHQFSVDNDHPMNKNGSVHEYIDNPFRDIFNNSSSPPNISNVWYGYDGRDITQGTTAKTDGSKAHNHGDTGSASNMPPYITVYCWRRIE